MTQTPLSSLCMALKRHVTWLCSSCTTPGPVLLPVGTEASHVVGQAFSHSSVGAGAVENREYPLERRSVQTGSAVAPRVSAAYRAAHIPHAQPHKAVVLDLKKLCHMDLFTIGRCVSAA